MSLRVNVQGGTSGGTRKPYAGGHAPTCACTYCHTLVEDLAADGATEPVGCAHDGCCDDTALD